MAKKEEPTITFDGKTHKIADLSDAAKSNLRNIGFVDQQIQQLKNELAVADTARIGYTNALKKEMARSKT